MEKVEFDEVVDIFDSYGIWMSDREILWYKKAWLALEKGGLTSYKNSIDKSMVFIRVFTLVMIYMEYCDLAFEEYCSYDFDWQGDSELTAFRIGQIFSQIKDEDLSDCDDSEALEYAFMELVENERANVFDSLIKNIGKGGASTILVSMYLSCVDMSESEEESEEESEDNAEAYSSEVVDDELSDYEEYEKDIEEYYGEIVNDVSSVNMKIFEWLSQGTYKIR